MWNRIDWNWLQGHFANLPNTQLFLLAYDIMMTIASMYGFGRNIDDILAIKGPDVGIKSVTKAILYSAIGQTILVSGTSVCKTSLALFLIRLAPERRNQVIIWIPNFFLTTAIVAALFVFWFSCRPIAYLWDREIPGGTCPINPGPISIYAGAWSVVVDFWYAAFPWWMLWNIQMPKREKRLIAGSLSLGIIAAACGIERAIQLKYLGSPNYTKDVVGIIIWHSAEFSTTMICIGIPVCRPLLRGWLANWETSKGSDTGAGSGWLKNKSPSGDNMFPMDGIHGSRSHGNSSKPGDEETMVLRNDDLKQNMTTSEARFVPTRSREALDNTSEESILGPNSKVQARAVEKDFGVRVKTEFDLKYNNRS